MKKQLSEYKTRGRRPLVPKAIDRFDSESLEKLNDLKPFSLSIKTLSNYNSDGRLNLEPSYQRKNVWPLAYKQELIQSIMKDIPIPTIFFVAQKETVSVQAPTQTYSVLDGKQRTKAILEYWNNEFSVVIDALSNKPMNKKELEESNDPLAKHFFGKLSDKVLYISCFPSMKIENQRNIFMVLNHSVPVSPNEKVYCENFLVKSFMSAMWDRTFRDYKCFESKIKGKNKTQEHKIYGRYDNLRYIHSIMMKLFGYTLEDVASNPIYCSRPLSKDQIRKSAAKLESELRTLGYVDGDEVTDEILSKMKIVKQVRVLTSVASALRSTFEYGEMLSKWEKNIIRDATLLFVALAYNNEFTPSQLREQSKILYDVLTEYAQWVTAETSKEIKSESLSSKVINSRTKKLYDMFTAACLKSGVDITQKNKLLTTNEIRQAKLESDGLCPMCGRLLTDHNVEIDHVDPKSKFGETVKIAICGDCNGRKSNWSLEEVQDRKSVV